MRIVLQRVLRASVTVNDKTVGKIDNGFLLLIGIEKGDTDLDLKRLATKIVNLRVFEDRSGKMNDSLLQVGGQILAVSQFTLYGNTSKGRRPSFTNAASPEIAEPIFSGFVSALSEHNVQVETGVFGAKMSVQLTNEGPVTLILEQ